MAKSDLGYVNGLIASMYKTLIPRDKLMRLAEAEPEEIFRALKEQGYAGDARSSRDYQILLENETEKLLRFISDGDFGKEVEALSFEKRLSQSGMHRARTLYGRPRQCVCSVRQIFARTT